MYTGRYNHSIDTKGRMIIPSIFREKLGDEFIITNGLDGCLFVYDLEEWEKFQNAITALPSSRKDARIAKRHFLGGAIKVEVDKQGRTLLPITLREFAKITKDVVVLGVGEKIEIWAKEVFEGVPEEDDISMEDVIEGLAEYGLEF